MKILMLGWELPPHNSGGLGVACYHLSKALSLSGASIDFVLPYSADHPDTDFMRIHAASSVKPGSMSGLGVYESRYFGENSNLSGGFSDLRGLQNEYVTYVEKLAMSSKPDVIHAHDWLTMEAGIKAKKITGSPLIVHVHATEFDRSGTDFGNPLVHEIEQEALQMADRIITVSNITKAIIMQKYGICSGKIEVLHNGIDVYSFPEYTYDDRDYRYFESLKSEGYTIVSVLTRFTVQKGLTHFLKAAASACEKHDKFVFLLAGDGEQRDELIRMSAELGIADKVYFTGYVRGKQWRDVYSVSDIFVMSSVSEPFGLTALEAAHHGCALLLSKQSGVGEVLKNVLRFDYWDIEVLADQMVGVALSPALSSCLRDGVREEYASLSWDQVARKCMDVFVSAKKELIAV